jgi:hypothetical protein
MEFKSPIKWVVAIIGDLRGLLKITDLPQAGNTNLLIVFLTDEQPEHEIIYKMQQNIGQMCN